MDPARRPAPHGEGAEVAAPRARVARTRVAAAPAPRAGLRRPAFVAALPSARSLLVGVALVVVAVALYLVARQPSVFGVRELRVEGASPALAGRIQHELAALVGTSLVTLDGDALVARVESLPQVRSASYDRAFPHSLVVTVVPEVPAAVLRRGAEAWLLSTRGRAMGEIEPGSHRRLPRIWAPKTVSVEAGKVVGDADVRAAVTALPTTDAEGPPIRIRTARSKDGELAFVLVDGLELRLGGPADVPLKLAAASEILPRLAAPAGGGPTYVDVSVPERPVAGGTLNPEVEVEG
jgi:cell division protein FtsQ